MLCWAEPHWAVQQFTLEWPEVGINPLIPLPSPLFLSPLDPGANHQLFVHCHLTNDFSREERKAAWCVSEVQRAGVTASERRGGWRIEEVKEKGREWERTRVNPSPGDKTVPVPFSLLSPLSAFLFHSPHGCKNGCRCVCICWPVELLWLSQVTVAGCVWGMPLHGSTCPLSNSTSVCLHSVEPFVRPLFSELIRSCSTDVL